MQIENIALLELFMETVCDSSEEPIRHYAATQPSTLTQQLGNSETIMGNLAKLYMDDGEEKLALATIRLLNFLEENKLKNSQRQESHPRLLNYVYPIV